MIKVADFFAKQFDFSSPVITIGTFDGIHTGHQMLLARVKQMAKNLNSPSVVITFTKHPAEVLTGKNPGMILPLSKRIELLQYYHIDVCLLADFTLEIAKISAQDFIADLVQRLHIQGIVAGQDFHFGNKCQGDVALIQSLGLQYGYQTDIIAFDSSSKNKVSSTKVRQTIWAGDLLQAWRLLGRPFSLIGEVIPGNQRGRELGFPTANLKLHHSVHPPDGVYASATRIQSSHLQNSASSLAQNSESSLAQNYISLVSIGTCPTFGSENLKIEVYILDYHGDLYGQILETQIYERIRGQITFNNAEELRQQIEADCSYVQNRWEVQQNCEIYARLAEISSFARIEKF